MAVTLRSRPCRLSHFLVFEASPGFKVGGRFQGPVGCSEAPLPVLFVPAPAGLWSSFARPRNHRQQNVSVRRQPTHLRCDKFRGGLLRIELFVIIIKLFVILALPFFVGVL